MSDTLLAAQTIDALLAAGVREWVLCAGARNATLVRALLRRDVTRFSLYDERSAGFFALGRIKATNRPVAVVTTSGTAAAELLPSMVEAFHSGLPLVAVTADRPKRLRGCGAPQTIDQENLFGRYAKSFLDLESGDTVGALPRLADGPVHWNLCFEEPKREEAETTDPLEGRVLPPVEWKARAVVSEPRRRLDSFLSLHRRPLVVVGPLRASETDIVATFLRQLGAPVIAEAPSGLRGDPRLDAIALRAGSRAVTTEDFDGVLRLGGVPCTRLWRDLEVKWPEIAVLSVATLPFPGLGRGECLTGPFHPLFDDFVPSAVDPSRFAALYDRDRKLAAALDECLAAEPRSEPALVRAVSKLVPNDALLYLGNSLPIREWDLAATWTKRPPAEVSRGANGIDGQISTFLGCARPKSENWALLGDLTVLYDLGAPWVLDQRRDVKVTLAVINNGGGRIFGRMFSEPEFQNRHTRGFVGWAAMWDLGHELWTEVPHTWRAERSTIVEVAPDDAATERFWQRWEAFGR